MFPERQLLASTSTPSEHTSSCDGSRPVSFAELGVPQPLVDALAADGKTSAFPIQAQTIPDSLKGRDILGRGETGSGKTLAYAIPLIARLTGRQARSCRPLALVLAPTRELANQINDVLDPLARICGLSTTTVYGGVRQSTQARDLRRGASIVVACPGRLEDLIDQGLVSLDDIDITVLDEADEMADMGFLPAVRRIMELTPTDGQRLLFSATLDHGIDTIVRSFLDNPKIHEIDSATAHVSTMHQHVFQVTAADKPQIIETLASGMGKRVLFTRTKHQAEHLAAKLVDHGIPAVELHGNLSQNQRARNLKAFSSGEVRVLVATDVAARGMDVNGIELVAQIDPPADPKSFLHRSGRTARAGHSGDVVTLVLPQQRRGTCQMLRRAGISDKVVRVTRDSTTLLDLVGETAPVVEGWSLRSIEHRSNRRNRSGGRFDHSNGHGHRFERSNRSGRPQGHDQEHRDEHRSRRGERHDSDSSASTFRGGDDRRSRPAYGDRRGGGYQHRSRRG
jgi:superfamily II DNA/RNA helicase